MGLNICLIANKFPILGRSSDSGFLWPIARGLASNGHKVTVIAAKSPLGKNEITRDGVKAFYLFEGFPNLSHLAFSDAAYNKFVELHKTLPFDIVHSIDDSAIKIAQHKKELKVPVAYDVDATQMSQLFSILSMAQESVGSLISTGVALAYKFISTYFSKDKSILKSADGIFVTSPEQRIFLERYYLYPDFHIYTVPYSVEIGKLEIREPSDELRNQLNIPEDAHVVVTVSDMTDTQEMKNLFVAFEKLAIRKANAHLIVVGNGPKWKEIEFEMLSLALGKRVHMTGALNVKELADYVALGQIFVNMSLRTTGFEPSIIEAMAQKKVIIGSEMSSIAHIVEDGVDGFLLRPADTDSLGEIFLSVFQGTTSTQEMGEKARQKVLNWFDVKKMSPALADAYERILNNRK